MKYTLCKASVVSDIEEISCQKIKTEYKTRTIIVQL